MDISNIKKVLMKKYVVKFITLLLLLMGCSTEPEDCAGVVNGTAIIDDCGICTEGTTELEENFLMDCAGVCGGDTAQSECDECISGSFDCLGMCDGEAVKDDCGICDGDNASMDSCGICGGDNSTCNPYPLGSFYQYPDITTIMQTDEFGNTHGICGDGDYYGKCYSFDLYNSETRSIDEDINIPDEFSLSSAYPNPFNPTTTIQFMLPVDINVNIFVVNQENELITTLVDTILSAASWAVAWQTNGQIENGYYRVIADFGEYECFQNVFLSDEYVDICE